VLSDKQNAVLFAFPALLATASTPEKGFRYYAVAEACSAGPYSSLWKGTSMSSMERSIIRLLTSLKQQGYLCSTTWTFVDPPRSNFERWSLSNKGETYVGVTA
jgi:hypothetical protein